MSNFLTKRSFNSQKMSTFVNMKCRLIPDVSCRENQHLAMHSQNLLILNDLGGGVAQQLIHTLFLQTTCSDATQGHLTDSSCPVDNNHSIQFPM